MISTRYPALTCFSSFLLLGLVGPCLGETFDAQTAFAWVDQSCNSVLGQVNAAGDEYNALVAAAVGSFVNGNPNTELGKGTLQAYFGTAVGDLINSKYIKLQSVFANSAASRPKPLELYCDGTAFEWVTTYQEGPQQGQLLPGLGQWHAKAGRYNPTAGPLYLSGTKTPQRTSICQDPTGRNAQGVSAVGGLHVILCPDAFNAPILGAVPATLQTIGTSLDALTSTGAILLHEVTHCILSTKDTLGGYKINGVLLTARISTNAQKNADTWMYYAMAVRANQNAWVVGLAQALDNWGPTAPRAPPAPGSASRNKRDTLPSDAVGPQAAVEDKSVNAVSLPRSPELKVRQGCEVVTMTMTVTVTQSCSALSADPFVSGGISSATGASNSGFNSGGSSGWSSLIGISNPAGATSPGMNSALSTGGSSAVSVSNTVGAISTGSNSATSTGRSSAISISNTVGPTSTGSNSTVSTGVSSAVSASNTAGATTLGSYSAGLTGKSFAMSPSTGAETASAGLTNSGSTKSNGASYTSNGPKVSVGSSVVSGPNTGIKSTSSTEGGTSLSSMTGASGFTTMRSNPGTSAASGSSSASGSTAAPGSSGGGLTSTAGYLGPVPLPTYPASLSAVMVSEAVANTVGLSTYTSTTTPIYVEISSGISSNGHSQKTNSVGPFPIFWSHTCWFCPPGLCLFCGALLELPPGIYPPGSIIPPPGWIGPLPAVTVGNDGTPTYDEDKPQQTNPQQSSPDTSQVSSVSNTNSVTSNPATSSSSEIKSSATSSFSMSTSGLNYIFETPEIYSQVSDTIPYSSVSALVASEFSANSIDGYSSPASASVSVSISAASSTPIFLSPSSTQTAGPASTTFSPTSPNTVTLTTTARPSSSLAISSVAAGGGFSCTSV